MAKRDRMNKYIFLDFDGVLNDPYWLLEHGYRRYKRADSMEFDLRRVEYLARIVDYTGAKLVLSSSWNKREGVKEFFEYLGFDVVGQLGYYSNRGQAIKKWLSKNNCKECDYIIIDDEYSDYDAQQLSHLVYIGNSHTMGWILSNFRLSGELVGLDEGHIPWALDLLKGDIEGYNNGSKWSDGSKK